MKLKTALSAAALTIALSNASLASSTDLSFYQQLKRHGSLPADAQDYITGVGDGYVKANDNLMSRNLAPLYCQPPMALNATNYEALIDEEIARRAASGKAYDGHTYIATILLDSLMHTFPCPK